MRYRNKIFRVCREGCISLKDSKCFLHNDELIKITIDGIQHYIVSEKCIYKKDKNKGNDDNTKPLFEE